MNDAATCCPENADATGRPAREVLAALTQLIARQQAVLDGIEGSPRSGRAVRELIRSQILTTDLARALRDNIRTGSSRDILAAEPAPDPVRYLHPVG